MVNQWLRQLPVSGAPASASWAAYACVVREWLEFLAARGAGLFDSRDRLRQALGAYSEFRGSGPAGQRFAASTWNRHVSVLSVFYRWAIAEGHAAAEPFAYKTARALFGGTSREGTVNLASRRRPKPHARIRYLEPDLPDGRADARFAGRELPVTRRSAGWRWRPGCGCRSSVICWCGRSRRCRPRRGRCRSLSLSHRG